MSLDENASELAFETLFLSQDGSAVELIGLSFACLRWLASLHEKGLYPHGIVSRKDISKDWTLKANIKALKDLIKYVKVIFFIGMG